jgi:hypothetical protein
VKFWKVSKLYPKHVEGISKMKQDEGSIPSASTGMFPCLEKQGGGSRNINCSALQKTPEDYSGVFYYLTLYIFCVVPSL